MTVRLGAQEILWRRSGTSCGKGGVASDETKGSDVAVGLVRARRLARSYLLEMGALYSPGWSAVKLILLGTGWDNPMHDLGLLTLATFLTIVHAPRK
jgi:hypothetical protein